MATQSSISVSGSSEQKVPSVRKGGRGGGGNRNSGGGPGHSGHSVLSSVSSSSILHLSVLKTTRKINARLILLTELLIGTRGRETEPLSLPLTHHLVIYSPFSFLLLPPHARNSLPTRVAVLPFLFFGRVEANQPCSSSLLSLETESLPFQTLLPPRKRRKTQGRGKQSTPEISLLGWWSRDRTRALNNSFTERKKQKGRETTERKGKGEVMEDKLVSKTGGYRRGKTGSARGGVKKGKKKKNPVDRESWRPRVKLITGQDPLLSSRRPESGFFAG